jgi:hypothetical protein
LVDLAIDEGDADGTGEDKGGDFGFEVFEKVMEGGGVMEGGFDVGEESGVHVKAAEPGLEGFPFLLDLGITGLNHHGEEVLDFALLAVGHFGVGEFGAIERGGTTAVDVEQDLGPFGVAALIGFADGDGDLDFAFAGAEVGDVSLDAEVSQPLRNHACEFAAGGLGLREELKLGADEGANEAVKHRSLDRVCNFSYMVGGLAAVAGFCNDFLELGDVGFGVVMGGLMMRFAIGGLIVCEWCVRVIHSTQL